MKYSAFFARISACLIEMESMNVPTAAEMSPITPEHIVAAKPVLTPVINQSIRTLQPIDLLPGKRDFTPHPEPALDGRGHPTKIGITEIVRDKTGEVTAIKYRGISGVKYFNPKDSADAYAVQTMLVKNGVMILPTENTEQAGKLNKIVKRITHGRQEISLKDFDRLLKQVHRYYIKEGLVPDMYNSTTAKFGRVEKGFTGHRTIDDAKGIYARDSGVQHMVIIEGEEGERIPFKGTSAHVENQYGETRIVVVRDGEEWRKLDYEYAVKNLRHPDGSEIKWAEVPRVSHRDVRAHMVPSAVKPLQSAEQEGRAIAEEAAHVRKFPFGKAALLAGIAMIGAAVVASITKNKGPGDHVSAELERTNDQENIATIGR